MEPPAQELRSIRDWQGMCWERDLPDWRRDLCMQSELRAPESLQRSGDSRTPLPAWEGQKFSPELRRAGLGLEKHWVPVVLGQEMD